MSGVRIPRTRLRKERVEPRWLVLCSISKASGVERPVVRGVPLSASPARIPGVPPGMVDHVIAILGASPSPMRRRKILDALDSQGHRISLAGLNRLLQHCKETGLTRETPEGVLLAPDHRPGR